MNIVVRLKAAYVKNVCGGASGQWRGRKGSYFIGHVSHLAQYTIRTVVVGKELLGGTDATRRGPQKNEGSWFVADCAVSAVIGRLLGSLRDL